MFAGGLITNNKVSAALKSGTEGKALHGGSPARGMMLSASGQVSLCPEMDVPGIPPFGSGCGKRGGWGCLLARAPIHSAPLFPSGRPPGSSIPNDRLESQRLSNITPSQRHQTRPRQGQGQVTREPSGPPSPVAFVPGTARTSSGNGRLRVPSARGHRVPLPEHP